MAQSKNWIEVKNSGIFYFGKKLADYKYENAIEFLTDVILASGKDMASIPIKNTADGMAIREIRDEATDAIAKAKSYKSKGGNDPLVIVKMDNRSYMYLSVTDKSLNSKERQISTKEVSHFLRIEEQKY